jgi:hypothetical protein
VTDADHSKMQALEAEIETLRAENERLRSLLGLDQLSRQQTAQPWEPSLFAESGHRDPIDVVDQSSSSALKIALFRSLFLGREDVFALRWESKRTGKTGWSPVVVGGWANAKRPGRQYVPLSEEAFESHLSGESHLGIYPLLRGDDCRLLA